ncbi:hypothetical protein ACC806_35035 [Rhizobium ruizarguesonis]
MTVAATFLIAISCGVITYRISIQQAKAEIDAAFQLHIERMHNEHREFVQAVETEQEPKD